MGNGPHLLVDLLAGGLRGKNHNDRRAQQLNLERSENVKVFAHEPAVVAYGVDEFRQSLLLV